MVQINLLPDIKKQYIKSQQIKHTVIVASVLISVVAFTIAALLFAYVRIVQPQHRANLQTDIDAAVSRQKEFPDAAKLVTIQNALKQIGQLQNSRSITSRSFAYVASVTPLDITYRSINYDSVSGLMTLTGTAKDTDITNELANNIKSATYTYQENNQEVTGKPFTSSRFSSPISKSEEDGTVAFTMEIGIAPELFAENRSGIEIHVDASSEKLLMKFDEKNNEGLFSKQEEGETNE